MRTERSGLANHRCRDAVLLRHNNLLRLTAFNEARTQRRLNQDQALGVEHWNGWNLRLQERNR
jgi:hypothetical protein